MSTKWVITGIVLGCSVALSGCVGHYGTISPNSMLADFNKSGRGYYLHPAQVPIGADEAKVKAEYGPEYDVISSETVDGKLVEQWRFISFRATFSRDPVDKHVIVTLTDHRVTDVKQVFPGY